METLPADRCLQEPCHAPGFFSALGPLSGECQMRLLEARADLPVCLGHPMCPFAIAKAEGINIVQNIFKPCVVYQQALAGRLRHDGFYYSVS